MTRRTFVALCLLLFAPIAGPARQSPAYGLFSSVAQGFSPVFAQTLDRTKQPPVGKLPELRVPIWTKSTLSNGAELIVSEKHDLPLVSFTITFLGGSDQFVLLY